MRRRRICARDDASLSARDDGTKGQPMLPALSSGSPYNRIMEAPARPQAQAEVEESIRYATVLTEIGELYDAELAVAEALERQPENLTALDLLAKIKHMRGELSAAIGCWAQVHTKTHPGEAALMRL